MVQSLTSEYSIEMTPREVQAHPGLCAERLRPGTRVYLTALPNARFSDTVEAAVRLRAEGMRPVPHIAARNVPSPSEVDHVIGALADVGVTELLVIAGSAAQPRGSITESMQILRADAFVERGITRVGVAGHPEGNRDIGPDGLAKALRDKNEFAAESGCEVYLLTQFCFAADPIVAWERRIRAEGNRLPVHIGLPGLTSPLRLAKFGLACGVGPSLKALSKQAAGIGRLVSSPAYRPEETLLGLAASVRTDPASLIAGVHFFPFGAITRTATWATRIADGEFQIDDRQRRLAVTA